MNFVELLTNFFIVNEHSCKSVNKEELKNVERIVATEPKFDITIYHRILLDKDGNKIGTIY